MTGLIAFIACRKYTEPSAPETPVDQTVTASLQGRVLDENGLPVQDAAVSSGGGATTTTDVNGIFKFTNIQLSSRFGFVKVVKQGYFTGSRTQITTAGSSNYITINLLPRVAKGVFPVASGGTVTVQGGNTVSFDGASVMNAGTGAAYSGTVHVFAAYLDPKDGNLPAIMPGDLRGISAAGKETGLQTFGMMAVELEGDGGEKLQIATGKKATLTMAIPASLQASAPATIPLWYFNDTTGKWMEQGSAAKLGNTYTGQVGHFSYWNCDMPVGLVNFKLYLKDQQGHPVAYTNVQFRTSNYGLRGGSTDSTGFVSGWVIKNETMTLEVTNRCGEVLYSQSVGPALADMDLGTLTVTLNSGTVTVTGKVVDCSNTPVTTGFVNIQVDGLNYRTAVANGNFSQSIIRCNATQAEMKLTAGDYSSQQIGTASSVSVTSGQVNAGQLVACGENFTQFVKVTLDGTDYSVTNPPDDSLFFFRQDTSSFIYSNTSFSIPNPRTINFRIDHLTQTGSQYIMALYIAIGNNHYNQVGLGTISCTITTFGQVGSGYIEGTFDGTVQDDAKQPHPVTGSFKVLRNN